MRNMIAFQGRTTHVFAFLLRRPSPSLEHHCRTVVFWNPEITESILFRKIIRVMCIAESGSRLWNTRVELNRPLNRPDRTIFFASYAASRYCFWRRLFVRLSERCLFVHEKSRKLLVGNWKTDVNFVGICPRGKLEVTFDLWPRELFSYFSAHVIPFEWLYLATSFSVWRYNFRIFRTRFTFKVMRPRSRSRQQQTVACNSKNTDQKLPGLDRNICYDKSNS